MSLSFHHTPISGNCVCRSEKTWKRLANRRYRAAVRRAILSGIDPLPHIREVSDVWTFGKDGKSYWGRAFVDNWPPVWKMFGK